MLIRVMYADGRLGLIKPQLLDSMADRKLVSGILRSDGWALVGRDIIRSHRRSKSYDGPERRAFYLLNVPLERNSVMRLLIEVALVAGPLVLISIMLSGLL
jgi:hypothetical protein